MIDNRFPVGEWGVVERVVTGEITARALGSGLVDLLGTPFLVALAEQASVSAVAQYLDPGETTVGVRLEVSHLAATPVGMKVTVRSQLIRVEGRRLFFHFEAHDEVEKIGEGSHERAVVLLQRIMEKATAKKAR